MNSKLVAIYRHALETGKIEVTLREAVKAVGYSEKQVKRDIRAWETMGWVTYQPARGAAINRCFVFSRTLTRQSRRGS
ncbi:hypothetical protein [Exiguobacterium sp. AM39-5BH]|uniref:hypothetical protein n=1 Tax=Exiguobacterium sp. AM39-5BH TaxID=2292355 RepID=UPI000FE1FCA8|nr:hypothetical protein [Exiguobacterium sp. AM39-5BH]